MQEVDPNEAVRNHFFSRLVEDGFWAGGPSSRSLVKPIAIDPVQLNVRGCKFKAEYFGSLSGALVAGS